MPSFRKDVRALASRAVDELKKEVKAHFQDLPPWEDYDPDIIDRYEQKLQEKERRQRRRVQISDPDSPGHISGTRTTQHRDRRHEKEHRHRHRRRQVNEHYNRSSTAQHKAEAEHRHGVPRVVQPEHGAVRTERSTHVTITEPIQTSPHNVRAENLARGEHSTPTAPHKHSNYQIKEGELVPCHDQKDSHRSSPKKTVPRVEPRHEHRNSHRVGGRPSEPKNAKDNAEEFRALIRTPSPSPSSVYSSYSDDEQGTIVADQNLAHQPTTQATSMLSSHHQYVNQPISQREDDIWKDNRDDWKSEEEEKVLAADQKRQGTLDQQARIEKWRNQVWPGNPEPCSDPSFVTEPRAQSTLERIGNIRLPNMSTASVTTRFSEFC